MKHTLLAAGLLLAPFAAFAEDHADHAAPAQPAAAVAAEAEVSGTEIKAEAHDAMKKPAGETKKHDLKKEKHAH
ncbi:MAG: hypothetical protein INF43_04820 [Alphaproteobacteria bacterium]|jgi:hypothetical protein|nr:hypothetical protein [Alphaproteobacteria bacterium]